MNRRENLFMKMTETLDLPPELIAQVPRVTLEGNELLHVENHGGILDYQTHCIRVRTALGVLMIGGSGLCIRIMDRTKILIGGRIACVEYQETDHA